MIPAFGASKNNAEAFSGRDVGRLDEIGNSIGRRGTVANGDVQVRFTVDGR